MKTLKPIFSAAILLVCLFPFTGSAQVTANYPNDFASSSAIDYDNLFDDYDEDDEMDDDEEFEVDTQKVMKFMALISSLDTDDPSQCSMLNLAVHYLDMYTPLDLGDGMVIKSITLEDNAVNFNFDCDFIWAYSLVNADDEDFEDFTIDTANEFYELFTILGGDEAVNEIVSQGIEIKCNLTVNDTTDVYILSIPAKMIENAENQKSRLSWI